VLQSKALTEDQVDTDLQRKNDEYLATKKRKLEVEKQNKEAKKTLLDKHAEKLQQEPGIFDLFEFVLLMMYFA
jgi:hypothetical protein